MKTELILIIAVMLVTILLNTLVLHRLSQQIQSHRHDTQVLAVTNRSLENRVDRLATAVDQSLHQLHRALELSSAIHLLMFNRLRDPAYVLAPTDISRITTYLLELKAIAVVNGDTTLIDRVGRLRDAIECILDPLAADGSEPPRRKLDVSDATESVQRKLYDLLASATRTQP